MGIALETCEVFSEFNTLVSLELEQTVTKAFFTYSEINVLVSRDFFINFENIRSNSVSSCLLSLIDSSFTTTSALLLSVDLRLSESLITSGIIILVVLVFNS